MDRYQVHNTQQGNCGHEAHREGCFPRGLEASTPDLGLHFPYWAALASTKVDLPRTSGCQHRASCRPG